MRLFALCTKIDNIIIDTVLTYDGVNERTIEPNVFLYPNLASSYVTIYVQDQNVRLTEVELFDINGRRLRTMSAVSQQLRISIDNLANGMYFVKIFCGA